MKLGEVVISAPALAAKLRHPTPSTHSAVQNKLTGGSGVLGCSVLAGGLGGQGKLFPLPHRKG